jgi:2,5-diketo-D-gluconate reductase B
MTDPDVCTDAVKTALETGYRHIDTAEAYGNEAAVGAGILDAAVPREDVFLATKVLHPRFTEEGGYTREGIVENVEACLDRLGVERVDLLYGVHWPAGGYDPTATFDACRDVVEAGLADSLGVCNMTPTLIDEARAVSDVPIDVLQIEMHPLLQQRRVRRYCREHDITLVAYGPLGNGTVLDDPTIQEVAEKYDVSEAQVSLAWIRETGAKAIPKASTGAHIRDNWASMDLELDEADRALIDDLDRSERVYDPDYAPDWEGGSDADDLDHDFMPDL